MPRPRIVKKGAFLTAWLEEEYLILLDRVARAEGVSRSELLRRIIVEWLESPEVKAKYGLQVVFAEQVARASTSKLTPLTKKKLEDVENTLKEVEPVIDSLSKKLPSLVEEAKRLVAERRQVEEWRAQKATLRIGGREVPAEKYYWKWRARADGMFKLMEGALREWRDARAKFFKVVYYPWLKYLRREVPPEVLVTYEDRIAALLDKIDRAEPFAHELEKLLRQPSAKQGEGVKR
jgi:hypothetical protein